MTEAQKFPRVLILNGEPFNSSSATGITLSNLFRGWPKDKLAQVYTANIQPDLDLCPHNWKLGNQDLLFVHQLNRLRGNSQGSRVRLAPVVSDSSINASTSSAGQLRNMLIPWVDLLPYQFSLELLRWIQDFQPQVIYSLLGNIRLIRAVDSLSARFSVPVVPHFMDDWMTTYSSPGYGRVSTELHKKIIQNLLFRLVKRSSVGFSIGEAMAEEYSQKFGLPFKAFMNPVKAVPLAEKPLASSTSPIEFVYVGGLHLSRWQNLKDIGEAMIELRNAGLEVQLLVYAPRADIARFGADLERSGIQVRGTLTPDEVAGVLQRSDVVVHVESFLEADMRYTRLSVSTKIPQYFAAGLPVLSYSPEQVASSRYVRDSNAGLVVGRKDPQLLKSAVQTLVEDVQLRVNLGASGRHVALERHDEVKVRDRFRNALVLAVRS